MRANGKDATLGSLKRIIRKFIPLRASVFEAYRKKQLVQYESLAFKLEEVLIELRTASRFIQSSFDAVQNDLQVVAKLNEETLSLLKNHVESDLARAATLEMCVDILQRVSSDVTNACSGITDAKLDARRTLNDFRSWTYGYDFERTRLPEEREFELRRWFMMHTGNDLNLDDPQTYNEKIQWMKIRGPLREMGRLADKYLVRDFVTERIGSEYLVPLLGAWDDPKDIDFDGLPDQFVLKVTNGCAWNVIVKDKSTLDISDAVNKLSHWQNTDFSFKNGFEMHYRFAPPRIIAEEYLENVSPKGGTDLFDYKFWCFDGRVEYIQFLENRAHGLKMSFYNRDWVKQSFVYSFPRNERDIPMPDNLAEMIQLAEKLADGFPHVRVDFYRLDDGTIRFGEMTFTSASGVCKWDPPEADELMGKLFKLPFKPNANSVSVSDIDR